jgi:hypothetical protein
VRSGDWKLIRWFGLAEDDPARLELYNVREDLGESMNRAAADPARVQILDALITGFLDDTGATYPRANPAFQASASQPAAANTASDPLEGWKARQCEAVVKDGVLTMTGKGNAPFLGHGMGRTIGPAVVNLRVRSPSGGAGRVEWLPGGAGDATGAKSVPFEFAAGDWRDVSVEVPATGALGVVRLYLPAASEPVELDWIEVRAQEGKAQRWDFKTP